MTPEQLEWFGNLLNNQGVAVVALLLIFAFIGFMFWPWFTKQYDKGQERSDKQALEFASAVKGFTELIATRDQLRFTEHGQYLEAMATARTDFLTALNNQRIDFITSLNKRDDASINIVQALGDLSEQIKDHAATPENHTKRGA